MNNIKFEDMINTIQLSIFTDFDKLGDSNE